MSDKTMAGQSVRIKRSDLRGLGHIVRQETKTHMAALAFLQ